MKIIEKLRIGARVKKVYDSPKTPYQRLLESPDIDEKVKTNLHQRAAALHPIELKYLLDDAVTKLMNLSQHKWSPLSFKSLLEDSKDPHLII